MSPSVRSILLICRASQSSGIYPRWCRSLKMVSNSPACSAWLMPRKSGMRQTSQSRRTDAPSVARAKTSSTCASALSAFKSSDSRARTRRSSSGGISKVWISRSILPNCSAWLRQFTLFCGVKLWSMIARATPSSSAGASPVVPKVPDLNPRPARPAICANSLGASGRIRRPSNLLSAEKAT